MSSRPEHFSKVKTATGRQRNSSSEEAWPGARALVSLPKDRHGVGRREARNVPSLQNLSLAWMSLYLKFHRENWGLGLSIILHPHSWKKDCI